jgi:hypothetical protein
MIAAHLDYGAEVGFRGRLFKSAETVANSSLNGQKNIF